MALQKEIKALYPEAQIHTFQGKGHFPYLNAAASYNTVLRAFLLDEPQKSIQRTINNYFEGRKKGDVALLQKAFHADATLRKDDDSYGFRDR